MTVIASIAKVTSPALKIHARPLGVRHACERVMLGCESFIFKYSAVVECAVVRTAGSSSKILRGNLQDVSILPRQERTLHSEVKGQTQAACTPLF
jgi:hypothetical protein